MQIQRQEIYFRDGGNNNGVIIIQKNPEGRICIECEGIFPVIVLRNAGIAGLIGPDLDIDTLQHSLEEKSKALKLSIDNR